ncbi:MAG: IMPACT family protein [Xanthomonadaceae bacterium]|nr:IMPACT family protein [Xanthomonadaceae bacterium]
MNRIVRVGRFEQRIRNSRFIGVTGPARDEAEAREFIQAHGAPGCRHVCFAWRIGESIRFDDAGEPGGTAGRPLLAALDHHALDFSVVVVNRFFGGIKLGTGGLARAYGGTAMDAIANAVIEPIIETVVLECRVPFDSAGDVHQLAERHGAEKRGEEWNENGLRLEVEIARERADAFVDELTAITHGESSIKKSG